MIYESHCHTPLCKHASGMPVDYAEIAVQRGFSGITFTCHNPMPDGFSAHVRMMEAEFPEYERIVDAARQAYSGQLDVRIGIEADYFPGYESHLERQLSYPFSYVLGSVHPQLKEMKARFLSGSKFEYQQKYFELLADSAETGLFDCLAHPDLVKNESVGEWNEAEILPFICRALDRIAATGVAMEINTSGVNKRIPEMNPFPRMLREMKARDIPVVIGSDAHVEHRVGDGYLTAATILAQAGYDQVNYFVDRQPHQVALEDLSHALSDECISKPVTVS